MAKSKHETLAHKRGVIGYLSSDVVAAPALPWRTSSRHPTGDDPHYVVQELEIITF